MSKIIGGTDVPHLLSQVPRVSVTMSRKINLGNYESTDIMITLSNDVTDIGVISETIGSVEELLNKKVGELLKSKEDKK